MALSSALSLPLWGATLGPTRSRGVCGGGRQEHRCRKGAGVRLPSEGRESGTVSGAGWSAAPRCRPGGRSLRFLISWASPSRGEERTVLSLFGSQVTERQFTLFKTKRREIC